MYGEATEKLRFQLDTKTAVTIYKSLIIPVFIYCNVLSIFDNKSRVDHLKSIDSRATRIVNKHADKAHAVKLSFISSIKKKHACALVCKCVDGKFCGIFQSAEPRKKH